MYCILYNDYFFHKKGKIILFNDKNEINLFLNQFLNYTRTKALQIGRPDIIMQLEMGNPFTVEE